MDLTGHVRLLLGAPGQAPPSLPESAWRVTVLGPAGMADPVAVASAIRPSPMTPRAEKALVTAIATDDIDTVARLCETPGPVQEAARVLYASRLVALDPEAAAAVLGHVMAAPTDPFHSKVLRRYWPGLHVATALAPSVPALLPVSRVALGLLLAEVRGSQGRVLDALSVLQHLPAQPAVHLATAASLLATGEHARVLEITRELRNVDDIAALGLIARSVAARTLGDLNLALDAACEALSVTDRALGVLAAGLEERAHLYSLLKDDMAARADLEVLALIAGGTQVIDVPAPARIRRAPAGNDEHNLDRARDRMRRRITGVGEPGTFGGRHHSTYRDEIADMFALGKLAAVEELLLGLLDAVEDEVAELGVPLDATFFLTLADLYQDSGRHDDLVALRERFAAAEARAAVTTVPTDPVAEAEVMTGPVEVLHEGDPTLRTPAPAPPNPDPFLADPAPPRPAPAPPAPTAAATPSVAPAAEDAPGGAEPVAPEPVQPEPPAVETVAAVHPEAREAEDVATTGAVPADEPVEPPAVVQPAPADEPLPAEAAAEAPIVEPPVEAPAAEAPIVEPPVEAPAAEAPIVEPAPADEPVLAEAAVVEPPPPVEPPAAEAPAVEAPAAEAPIVEPPAVEPPAAAAVVVAPSPSEPGQPSTPVEPAFVPAVHTTPVPEDPPAPETAPEPVLVPAAAAAGDEVDLPNRGREDGRTSLIAMASVQVTPLTPSARRAAAEAEARARAEAEAEAERDLTPVERAIRGPRLRSL